MKLSKKYAMNLEKHRKEIVIKTNHFYSSKISMRTIRNAIHIWLTHNKFFLVLQIFHFNFAISSSIIWLTIIKKNEILNQAELLHALNAPWRFLDFFDFYRKMWKNLCSGSLFSQGKLWLFTRQFSTEFSCFVKNIAVRSLKSKTYFTSDSFLQRHNVWYLYYFDKFSFLICTSISAVYDAS